MKFAKIKLTSEEFLGNGGEADEVNAGGNGGSAIACGPVIDRRMRQSYPNSSRLNDTFRSDISWPLLTLKTGIYRAEI